LLASGTLTKELQETGWELLSGLAPATPPARRGSAAPDARKRRRQAVRDELRAAREQRTELARRLREARRDEKEALRRLEQAREAIRALEAELAEVDEMIERAGEG
jgi:chromosome segregation ATPase